MKFLDYEEGDLRLDKLYMECIIVDDHFWLKDFMLVIADTKRINYLF
jgi:hypothetical protein